MFLDPNSRLNVQNWRFMALTCGVVVPRSKVHVYPIFAARNEFNFFSSGSSRLFDGSLETMQLGAVERGGKVCPVLRIGRPANAAQQESKISSVASGKFVRHSKVKRRKTFFPLCMSLCFFFSQTPDSCSFLFHGRAISRSRVRSVCYH